MAIDRKRKQGLGNKWGAECFLNKKEEKNNIGRQIKRVPTNEHEF